MACTHATAGEQQQCIDQQRLSGTGFAGDDGQTRAERHLKLGDDPQVLDPQFREHLDYRSGSENFVLRI